MHSALRLTGLPWNLQSGVAQLCLPIQAGGQGDYLCDDRAPGLLGADELLGELGVDHEVLQGRVALVGLVNVVQEDRPDDAPPLRAKTGRMSAVAHHSQCGCAWRNHSLASTQCLPLQGQVLAQEAPLAGTLFSL